MTYHLRSLSSLVAIVDLGFSGVDNIASNVVVVGMDIWDLAALFSEAQKQGCELIGVVIGAFESLLMILGTNSQVAVGHSLGTGRLAGRVQTTNQGAGEVFSCNCTVSGREGGRGSIIVFSVKKSPCGILGAPRDLVSIFGTGSQAAEELVVCRSFVGTNVGYRIGLEG